MLTNTRAAFRGPNSFRGPLLACYRVLRLLLGASALLLAACASAPPADEGRMPDMPPALVEWSARELPGKRPTRYTVAQRDGRSCVLAEANRSVSLWRRPLQLAPQQLG